MNKDINNKKPSCYAPWITTYEWSDGNITPCCEWSHTAPGAIRTKEHMSFEDRFNHPEMKKIKKQLLEGPISAIPGCINCVKMEEKGLWSLREQFTERVGKKPNKPIDLNEFKLMHMDYRESNLCNFSCKMCSSTLSSTHAIIEDSFNDEKEFPKNGVMKNTHRLQEYLDNLDDVKLVNFLGGEPTLMDSMYIIIKEIKKRKLESNMELALVTNGSVLHKDKDNLLEHLSGFQEINISVSIDVACDHHNYWRHKNTWNNVWKNTQSLYKFVQDNNNAVLQIRTALSWPTAFAARGVFELFKDMEVRHMHNLVTYPPGLSISQLPKHMLAALCVWWQDYPEIYSIFKNTTSMTNMKILANEKKRLLNFDKYHGNNFVDAFPEFKDFYNEIP